jgi:hypothetical protein
MQEIIAEATRKLTESRYESFMAVAEIENRLRVFLVAEEDGTQKFRVRGDYNPLLEDYEREVVSLDYKAGQVLLLTPTNGVVVRDAEELQELTRQRGCIGPLKKGEMLYELGTPAVATLDFDGSVLLLSDPRLAERPGLAFLDREGAVVSDNMGSPGDLYTKLHQVADHLPFHPEPFFTRLHDIHSRDVEGVDAMPWHILFNAINVANGDGINAPDYSGVQLSESCWDQAVASTSLRVQDRLQEATRLEGQPLLGSGGALEESARKIMGLFAAMPAEDIRAIPPRSLAEEHYLEQFKGSPFFQSQQDWLNGLVKDGLAKWKPVDPEVKRQVAQIYPDVSKIDIQLAETGDMTILVVTDMVGQALYFMPSRPELEEKPEMRPYP